MPDTEHPANPRRYLYERGEHRRKHCWNRDQAGFVPGRRRAVGVPTRAGVSYHGYPWQGRMPERILEELGSRAAQDGYEKEFKAWVKKHSKR